VDTLSVTIPLAHLPGSKTSFTLVDSFTAMGRGARSGFPAATAEHQTRLYLLEELDEVIGRHGLPEDGAGYDAFEMGPSTG
jgi:hypothetical protein